MKNIFVEKILHPFLILASFFGVIAACLLIAAIFTFPLWFWATYSAKTYTFFVLFAVSIFIFWQIFRIIKKNPTRHTAYITARIIFLCAGVILAVRFVLLGRRFFALCAFAIFLALSIGTAYLEKSRIKPHE